MLFCFRTSEDEVMGFYRRTLRIPRTELVSNDKVLKKVQPKRLHIFRNRKRQSTSLGHMMEKEDLENVTLT